MNTFQLKHLMLWLVWFGVVCAVNPYKRHVYVIYDQKLNGSYIIIPMTCYLPSLGVLS